MGIKYFKPDLQQRILHKKEITNQVFFFRIQCSCIKKRAFHTLYAMERKHRYVVFNCIPSICGFHMTPFPQKFRLARLQRGHIVKFSKN